MKEIIEDGGITWGWKSIPRTYYGRSFRWQQGGLMQWEAVGGIWPASHKDLFGYSEGNRHFREVPEVKAEEELVYKEDPLCEKSPMKEANIQNIHWKWSRLLGAARRWDLKSRCWMSWEIIWDRSRSWWGAQDADEGDGMSRQMPFLFILPILLESPVW